MTEKVNNQTIQSMDQVFANIPLDMQNIECVGFDLDNTLAKYKWPVFSQTLFMHALEAIVGNGYPEELTGCKYDVTFPVKGIWFDTKFGTFLKVDPCGNILKCLVGFEEKDAGQIEDFYTNKSISMSERIYVFNTSFQMPELMFFATVIDFLRSVDKRLERVNDIGVFVHGQFKPFPELFKDMRHAIDIVHDGGRFKKQVLDNLDEFLGNDGSIPLLLQTLKEKGKKVFMVTNCNFEYSNYIMRYLFSKADICKEANWGEKWINAFDIIFTQAKKPKFFSGQGNSLSAIHTETGLVVPVKGSIKSAMKASGHIFKGGSTADFEEALDITDGSKVLYVGDHIFGDILKCKKDTEWKTFMIIEELDQQISRHEQNRDPIADLKKIRTLQTRLEREAVFLEKTPEVGSKSGSRELELLGSLELSSVTIKDVNLVNLEKQALAKEKEIDQTYGQMGGIFQSGLNETLYSFQIRNYADIYAESCAGLLSYNLERQKFEARSKVLPAPCEKETKSAEQTPKVAEQISLFII